MALIIAPIGSGCASNPVRVLIRLAAPPPISYRKMCLNKFLGFGLTYPKIILSSPEGFVERNIGPKRKRHGAGAGDVNGDGSIDVLFERSASQPSGKWESGKVYRSM